MKNSIHTHRADDADDTFDWLASDAGAPVFGSTWRATNSDTFPEGPPAATIPDTDGGQGGTAASVAASGDPLIDGLLRGTMWSNATIYYTTPTQASDYQSGYNYDVNNNGISAQNEGFGRISDTQLLTVHYALNADIYSQPVGASGFSVEGFTNASIVYGGDGGTGTIRVANTSDNSTGNTAYPANTIYGGDAWMGTSIQTPTQGNYEWNNTLHELGHALGLKHGQDAGGPANEPLPTDHDSLEFSVMTYRSYVGGPTTGYTNGQWDYPQTYMMCDIAALQYMYGADFTSNGTDTVYTWNPTTGQSYVNGNLATNPGGNRIFMTIWDGGGNDTYDLSNYTTNLNIDLTPGGHSTFGTSQLAYLGTDSGGTVHYASGNVYNALLYQGNEASLIENAYGGSGDDQLSGNDANNTLVGNGGNDNLYGLDGNDALYGSAGNDFMKGGGGDDYLSGGDDNDTLKGGAGADTLIGGAGIDTANYSDSDAGVDVTLDGSGYFGYAQGDTLTGIENLTGSNYADTLRGNGGDNVINGGGGVDTMSGGAGNDTYYVDNASDVVLETSGNDTVLASVSYTLAAGASVETLATTNDAGTDAINLYGNEFAQTLRGNAAGNVLDGGGGADSLYGLDGSDVYYVDNAGDRVFEVNGQGTDYVYASVSYALQAGQSVEYLIANTGGPIDLTGNELAQSLYGSNGVNRLDGGGGADIMVGYDGDDSYFVDDAGDQVFEAAGQGNDTVFARASYVLAAGQSVEILRASSVASTVALDLTGNELDQTLVGNSGANRLDGGGGADTMRGGLGNDSYFVDNAGDLVFETGNGGNDTVFARTSYALQAGQSIEVLRASSVASTTAMDLTGNEIAQSLYGNAGANRLDGGGGADAMTGYGGDDVYFVDNSGDLVFEAAGGGNDTVFARTSYALQAGQSIEILRASSVASTVAMDLTGNSLAQTLYGNAGANVLDGGGGGDTMRGYGGDDTYVINNASDLVFEASGQGSDTVNSRVSYVLAAGQSVETLKFTSTTGIGNLNLTGNSIAQTLTGNNGNNVLDGGGGGDSMRGYAGDDTYVINSSSDLVFEANGQGNDTINARVSYTLAAGQSVETLKFTSVSGTGNLNLTGNAVAQTITGNNGNNILDGKGGADILRGYGGADSFKFSTALGASNIDHIVDFSVADDTIRLDQTIFSELGLGTLNPAAYKDIGVAGAVVDSSDRILYNHNTGALYYDSDGSGSHAAVQFAILDNKPAVLTNADFFVVA